MADWQTNGLREGLSIQGAQGEYHIEAVLNRGPHMTTARALDARGAWVVLKELRLEALLSWKGMELFERESGILGQLKHDCLPRLLDAFQLEAEAQTRFYLVCSWAEGESLLEKLNAGWRPQPDELLSIARQALDLLEYLQGFNPPVIHRDLKPANLILDADGRLHLVDFGAVQGLLNPDGGSTVVGTFGYMPPEQFSDRCVPASDLYALGATLVHLLTGKFPSDLPRKGLRLDYGSLPADSPLSQAWLDRLLAPELELRFRSAREAQEALDDSMVAATATTRSRLKFQRRGAQLSLAVEPAGLIKGLDWPARFAMLWLSLAWISQSLLIELLNDKYYLRRVLTDIFGVDYYQAYALLGSYGLNLATELLATYQVGLIMQSLATLFLFRSLIEASIRTTLTLQPERYTIRYSLGKIGWRAQGASSELLRLQLKGNSWLRGRCSRLIERSGHSLPGPGKLTPAQHRELSEAIAAYLQDLSPERAAAFRDASAEASPGLQLAAKPSTSPSLLPIWAQPREFLRAAMHRISESYWSRERHPWLYRELLPKRIQAEADAQGLTLRFDPRRRMLAWLPLMVAWFQAGTLPWLDYLVAGYPKYFAAYLDAVASGWHYDVVDAQLQLDWFCVRALAWGLGNLIVISGINHYLIAGQNQAELRLKPGGVTIKQRLGLPGRRERLVPIERWREVTFKRRLGRYALFAYEAGGTQHRLAAGLSKAEAIKITCALAEVLKQSKAPAELQASLQHLLAPPKPRWQRFTALVRKMPVALVPARAMEPKARSLDAHVMYRAMYGLWQTIRQKLRRFGSLRRGLSQRG